MKLVGNILWLLLAGIWMFLGYILAGIINCIFIITIPFGIQSFKLAGFALWPFGRVVVDRPGAGPVSSGCLNLVWLVTGGLWLALGHAITGILLCITVIGIPFGLQSFKLMGLALTPFGKMVVPASSVRRGDVAYSVPGAAPPVTPPPAPPPLLPPPQS
jgi:uncharacterized membrane protein YccF (DUF307 family)